MGLVGIVNIGLGNVDSVGRAVQHLGHEFVFCRTPDELQQAERIIFPGVGSFGAASELLSSTGFRVALRQQVIDNRKPILGICLGMQLLADCGTEGGGGEGLGLISGTVELHRSSKLDLPLPHIGWNDVSHSGGALFEGIPDGACFYFVHSYEFLIRGKRPQHVGYSDHGVDFVASIENGHVFGTQFHPEKSQEFGLKLLDNYIRYVPCSSTE